MTFDEKLEVIYADVLRRNPSEPEFHQAAREVLTSLGPMLAKRPELAERKLRPSRSASSPGYAGPSCLR